MIREKSQNDNAGPTKPANQAELKQPSLYTPVSFSYCMSTAPEGHDLGGGSSLQLSKGLTAGGHLRTTLRCLGSKSCLKGGSEKRISMSTSPILKGNLINFDRYDYTTLLSLLSLSFKNSLPTSNIFISGRWDPIEQQ